MHVDGGLDGHANETVPSGNDPVIHVRCLQQRALHFNNIGTVERRRNAGCQTIKFACLTGRQGHV